MTTDIAALQAKHIGPTTEHSQEGFIIFIGLALIAKNAHGRRKAEIGVNRGKSYI
jgi:hypothetical protein